MSDLWKRLTPLGLADRLFVGLTHKVHYKVVLTDHLDALVCEKAGRRIIVLKSSYPGNVQYMPYSEEEARSMIGVLSEVLVQPERPSVPAENGDTT